MMHKLWDSVFGQLADILHSVLLSGIEVLLAALLAALCAGVTESEAMRIAAVAAVALIAVKSVSSCAEVGEKAMQTLSDFSHVLLPCLSMAAAAGGAWTSAGAKYAASMLFLDGLVRLETTWAGTILGSYAAVLLAGHLTGNALLLSISGAMKSAMKSTLILLTSVFTVYLSLTGILSGTVDAAAAKTAKTVLSAALPVVGGILSDASGALLSGAQMLRNGVGVLGLLAVSAVCVCPYLLLGCHYLFFRAAGDAVASFSEKRVGGVIQGLADVYGMLLGMVGSVGVMLFVSIISLMRTVTPG